MHCSPELKNTIIGSTIAIPVASTYGALAGTILGLGAGTGAAGMALITSANVVIGLPVSLGVLYLTRHVCLKAGVSEPMAQKIAVVIASVVNFFCNITVAWLTAQGLGLGLTFVSTMVLSFTGIGILLAIYGIAMLVLEIRKRRAAPIQIIQGNDFNISTTVQRPTSSRVVEPDESSEKALLAAQRDSFKGSNVPVAYTFTATAVGQPLETISEEEPDLANAH